MKNDKSENNTSVKNEKELAPPYISVVKLDKVINLISERNYKNISKSIFEGYGFINVDTLLAIHTLKFLGLINDRGEPTALMVKMHLGGEEKKKEFEKILRDAYAKLFESVDTPQNLTSEQLESEFRVHYNVSKRIAVPAVSVFFKFCEYAGLKEESPLRKTDKTKSKKIETNKTKLGREIKEPAIHAGFETIDIAGGRMKIEIPSELKTEIFNEAGTATAWHIAIGPLQKFAEEKIPRKETPVEDTEDV